MDFGVEKVGESYHKARCMVEPLSKAMVLSELDKIFVDRLCRMCVEWDGQERLQLNQWLRQQLNDYCLALLLATESQTQSDFNESYVNCLRCTYLFQVWKSKLAIQELQEEDRLEHPGKQFTDDANLYRMMESFKKYATSRQCLLSLCSISSQAAENSKKILSNVVRFGNDAQVQLRSTDWKGTVNRGFSSMKFWSLQLSNQMTSFMESSVQK
ncbi:hypothetical protein Ciccas_005415 [Cichlidogyrus casuarinus]|uniref:Uncharacterized protein n=1 Tax=Cichlidogyrus casuarinus TaxID=1844966 RepID=A0ABD2Q8P7_9PLAT